MEAPGTEAQAPRPRAGRTRTLARVVFHGCLLVAFSAAAGALLIWPQWMNVDGSRQSLELQLAHERELQERLDTLRVVGDRLQDWKDNTRRVFMGSELDRYPAQMKAVADHAGATVVTAQVTSRPTPRWRSVSVQSDAWAEAEGSGGEIQPRAVHLVLTGSFASIYGTVGTLCGQQQLFIPDRWDISPDPGSPSAKPSPGNGVPAGRLRADVWATVFLVRQPNDVPKGHAAAGPVASRLEMEGQG